MERYFKLLVVCALATLAVCDEKCPKVKNKDCADVPKGCVLQQAVNVNGVLCPGCPINKCEVDLCPDAVSCPDVDGVDDKCLAALLDTDGEGNPCHSCPVDLCEAGGDSDGDNSRRKRSYYRYWGHHYPYYWWRHWWYGR